jgi:hypothetical protein
MSAGTVKKGDFVVCKTMPNGPQGRIFRVARDGSWCDVEWKAFVFSKYQCWTKRMRPEVLELVRSWNSPTTCQCGCLRSKRCGKGHKVAKVRAESTASTSLPELVEILRRRYILGKSSAAVSVERVL